MKKVFSIFLVVAILLCNSTFVYADDGVHGIYVGTESEPQEPREHNPQTGSPIQSVVIMVAVVFLLSIFITNIKLKGEKQYNNATSFCHN